MARRRVVSKKTRSSFIRRPTAPRVGTKKHRDPLSLLSKTKIKIKGKKKQPEEGRPATYAPNSWKDVPIPVRHGAHPGSGGGATLARQPGTVGPPTQKRRGPDL